MAHYDSSTHAPGVQFARSTSIMIASPASSLPSFYCACGYTHPCSRCSGLVVDRPDHQDLIECFVDIHDEFSKLANLDFSPPDIFMAPSPLRLLNPEAFIPRVVPIGPYHSKRQFSEMKKYKILAAKATEEGFVGGHTFKSLLQKVKDSLGDAKKHYDGEFDRNLDDKLAEILALDASFILQVMRAWAEFSESIRTKPGKTESSAPDNKLPSSPQKKFEFGKVYKNKLPRPVRKTIIHDFLLLENQIPLFLLREVMTMEGQRDTEIEENLGNFVCSLARQLLPPPLPKKDTISPNDRVTEDKKHLLLNGYRVTNDKKHLLDCLYDIFTGKGQSNSTITDGWTEIPTASNLCKAGIILEPSKEADGFKGILFEKHTLYVPRIRVGEDTKTFFRNLLAYESHCKVDTAEVLSYLKFMNSLIDTPADVPWLVEKKIINKASDVGSDEEVACMFNGLCINTVDMFTKEYLEAAEKLNEHYNRKLWKIWSEFKRTHLSRPWLVVSLLSAAALLLMTLLIAIYTLKLYYHVPPK